MFIKPFVLFLLILLLSYSLSAQKHTVSGHIKDAESAEHLIGASIYNKLSQQGTSANEYGFYSLTLPEGSVRIIFSYVGYEVEEHTFNLTKDTVININLSATLLDEVIVSAEEGIHEISRMSTIDIPLTQIKELPALLGEVDVLKVIQLLPGVQSGSEGTSGLYVRGGGPDQNLILLDGVPVYNPSHLFGFFSVFNADAIQKVELIKGGFPARYGGRLSSVLNINMKEGNMKKFHGQGTIGLLASKITLEGPIVQDKTSFIFSARRTYADLIARPVIRAQTGNTVGYHFYDLNGKINHKFSDRNRIYLSVYLGNDKFKSRFRDNTSSGEYLTESGIKWGNITSALQWNYVISSKLFSNVTATYSRYRFDLFSQLEEKETGGETNFNANEYNSGIFDWSGKIDFDFIPNPNHYIRFGINGIYHTFNPGAYQYSSSEELEGIEDLLGSSKVFAGEFMAYLEDEMKLGRRLRLNAGVHFSAFSVGDAFYTSVQPRLSSSFLLADNLSLKASYARMTQYIHLLTNSGIGLPTDLWLPSTEQVKPQDAWQAAIGITKTYKADYEFTIEGFYKIMDNLIEYKEGADFTGVDEDWQDKIETGSGQSYGGEVLLRKKHGRVTGWIGYTLSWANRQFENLNFGETFPYKFDRRHDIGTAVVFHWTDQIDVAASWVFGTGNAITLPENAYEGAFYIPEVDGFYPNVKQYSARNGYRMRAYHRLDLSISFLKQKKNWERKWTIGVYNAYSRRNPFYIDVTFDENGKKQFIQYSLFPVLPSVSYSFKF